MASGGPLPIKYIAAQNSECACVNNVRCLRSRSPWPNMLFSAPRTFVQPSAAFTRRASAAGRGCACRSRAANALAIAAAAGPCAPSPAPSDFSSGRLISATSTFGHLRHGQDRIARPVARSDAVAVEPHLLVQRPARRLDDAALDLVGQPVRVDDLTRIGRCEGARHLDRAARAVDFDLGDHRDDRPARFLYLAKPMPRPRVPSPFSPGLPVGLLGDRLDHRARARVLQVREAKRDRIAARPRAASSSMKDSIANTLA